MALFLGIDGGGSKTQCLVGDESRVIATATGGGSNVARLGESVARQNLHAVIEKACAMAGIAATGIDGVCAGVAGVSVAGVRETVQAILLELTQAPVQVVGDMEIALHDAFRELPGVVVISGTGSIAFGRDNHGQTTRAGGWGPVISDEGSGHWIGRAAVAATLRAHDGGEETLLAGRIAGSWVVSGVRGVAARANEFPAPDFASLFPLVLASAGQGDAMAIEILRSAGAELAGIVSVVIRRLWKQGQQVRVAIGGGVFSNSSMVRHWFYSALRESCPGACASFQIVNAARGALDLARKPGAKPKNMADKGNAKGAGVEI